jgi:phosphatidylglycerophosphate synthase
MYEVNKENPTPPIYDNSLYRRWIVRPLAAKLAPSFVSAGFTGNRVCWLKLIFGLGGAFILASKSPILCFIGMLFLQLHFLLDATDGEVARLRGEAARLSGEFLDKLFDHLPKTAMYFFWGYGTYRLTGSQLPLFCGAFLAAWTIYPRFCGVETLLERLDKVPGVYHKPEFHRAVGESFVVKEERGRADFFLTILVHPAMNLLTLFFLFEIFRPELSWSGSPYETRYVLLILFVFVALLNFVRKSIKFSRALDFS